MKEGKSNFSNLEKKKFDYKVEEVMESDQKLNEKMM